MTVALAANVANAHVTFRRRVSAAPAAMQIAPSDVVELVEVSAPGYKTMRYWLTFDRPTQLTGKLTKGSGLEEATLIALGEVAPVVAAVAPALAPVPAAVKPVESVKVAAPTPVSIHEPVAPAPRKIGRIAAEEPVAAPVVATAAAAEPRVQPVPTQQADPKPDPALAPEPIKAAEPVAVAPEPVARPAIDRATLSSVVGQHRMEILHCFAEGKKQNPTMKGTVTLQLQVDAAGAVRAQVQSTLNNLPVAACAIMSANAWQFPARWRRSRIRSRLTDRRRWAWARLPLA